MNAHFSPNRIKWNRPHVTPSGYPSPAALASEIENIMVASGVPVRAGTTRAVLEGIWTAFNQAEAVGDAVQKTASAHDKRLCAALGVSA